jgi:hypothetical protein
MLARLKEYKSEGGEYGLKMATFYKVATDLQKANIRVQG